MKCYDFSVPLQSFKYAQKCLTTQFCLINCIKHKQSTKQIITVFKFCRIPYTTHTYQLFLIQYTRTHKQRTKYDIPFFTFAPHSI